MKAHITVESAIEETPRVQQMAGLFDLPSNKTSRLEWNVDLPIEERPWNIGLITGPSGCGKSTIAKRLFPSSLWLEQLPPWSSQSSIIDGFSEHISIKEVAELLSAVGFSSPPAWLRPYYVLSTGQQFRCDLALLLATLPTGQIAVFDEFTSVVDRTVAQIGSHAVAKTIRARNAQFIAISCHDDIIEWLQPDWIYLPAENSFSWRSLRRRPKIHLEISRVSSAVWPVFAPHHYLSHVLTKSAYCFVASWNDRPIAFSAWLPWIGAGPAARREHRTVVLPDYQGVGIGSTLCQQIASLWVGLGYQARSTTSHPGYKASRQNSRVWRMTRASGLGSAEETGLFAGLNASRATTRATTGWLYIGPAMPNRLARNLLGE